MKKYICISSLLSILLFPALIVDYRLHLHKKRTIQSVKLDPIQKSVLKHSAKYNVDPKLILMMIFVESSNKPTAKSNKGATGLMQLMPSTAKELGVNISTIDGNIEGGVKYFAKQLNKFKDIKLALAAYNSGPGNVYKYKSIPPFTETINYVNRICKNYSCG